MRNLAFSKVYLPKESVQQVAYNYQNLQLIRGYSFERLPISHLDISTGSSDFVVVGLSL